MRLPRSTAFTLIELLTAIVIVAVLVGISIAAANKIRSSVSLANSANTIRQLTAGGQSYLADHAYKFWWAQEVTREPSSGMNQWYGFESDESRSKPMGSRSFSAEHGPLAGYIPLQRFPDPGFSASGTPLLAKYDSGYIGVGYNVELGGNFIGPRRTKPLSFWELEEPGRIVVFATTAQINTFQPPASSRNPMIEDFPFFGSGQASVHFRHGRQAMVGFANGSAGFLPLETTTMDKRIPSANIGRLPARNLRN